MSETPENTRNNLLVGNERNQGFTSEKQPTSEQKIHGWEVRRQKKLLTQKIVEKMTEGKTLDDYVDSLYHLATVEGNSKAIETINKGIEEQVDKSEVTVTNAAISIDL
ncbi:MAG: hypothetical protein IPK62_17230 [Bacteroidetes bacterium]|nr:hypothetical protein [Bacteroidota bacterium]